MLVRECLRGQDRDEIGDAPECRGISIDCEDVDACALAVSPEPRADADGIMELLSVVSAVKEGRGGVPRLDKLIERAWFERAGECDDRGYCSSVLKDLGAPTSLL